MINFTPTYITSQVFVSIAYCLLAMTYFINGRHKLLLTMIMSNASMGIGFFLLEGYVGVAMCGIAICRDITSYIISSHCLEKDKLKNTKLDWGLLVLWVSLFTIATFFTQKGFMTLFAYFATLAFTFSIWQKNSFIYRFLGIFVGMLWIIYNVFVKSIAGMTLESTLLLFVIAGFISYIKKNKSAKKPLVKK